MKTVMMMLILLNNFILLSYKWLKTVKKSFEKTRHVKNNDKSKKYILRGQRNARYH